MITNLFASVIYLFACHGSTDTVLKVEGHFFKEIQESFLEDNQNTPIHKTVRVHNGDTLVNIFENTGVSSSQAYKAVHSLKKIYNPAKSLKVGHDVVMSLVPESTSEEKNKYKIKQIRLPIDFRQEVILDYKNGIFNARKTDKYIEENLQYRNIELKSSLFADGMAEGVSDNIMHLFVKNFSYDVDFQRDIREGDRFEVLYEELYDPLRHIYKPGDLLYAAMIVGGAKLEIFQFKHQDGHIDYYNSEGKSVKKALLKTPLQTAIITSKFGSRKHPISGYTKMHRGVDFGAPTGTPVFSAGDGRVEFVGRAGGYGKYIKIKHNGTYSTAYAHLSNYAKGLKKRQYVKQGEIIGYVGSTGASTGPHLHFEVIKYGKQINPLNAKFQSTKKLSSSQMKAFVKVKEQMLAQVQLSQQPVRYVLRLDD